VKGVVEFSGDNEKWMDTTRECWKIRLCEKKCTPPPRGGRRVGVTALKETSGTTKEPSTSPFPEVPGGGPTGSCVEVGEGKGEGEDGVLQDLDGGGALGREGGARGPTPARGANQGSPATRGDSSAVHCKQSHS